MKLGSSVKKSDFAGVYASQGLRPRSQGIALGLQLSAFGEKRSAYV